MSQLKMRCGLSGSAMRDSASKPYTVRTLSREIERQCDDPSSMQVQRSIRENSPSVRGR
jgi:hypothetical protein